mmetsp:Transcript_14519/g.38360  ORF Transcript_14519/g.38360 Transcript_14519/m.38360 type:complete len:415 (-) Transcript_14519:194-1438(-)
MAIHIESRDLGVLDGGCESDHARHVLAVVGEVVASQAQLDEALTSCQPLCESSRSTRPKLVVVHPEHTQPPIRRKTRSKYVHPRVVRLVVHQVIVLKLQLLEQGRRRELNCQPLQPSSSKLAPSSEPELLQLSDLHQPAKPVPYWHGSGNSLQVELLQREQLSNPFLVEHGECLQPPCPAMHGVRAEDGVVDGAAQLGVVVVVLGSLRVQRLEHRLELVGHRLHIADLAQRRPRLILVEVASEVGEHVGGHVHHHLPPLGNDLLERERVQVDAERALDDHDRAVRARAHHLYAGERPEEDLALVRVLREPADVGATVDHALLHLNNDAHPRAIARRIAHCHRTLKRRAHECRLDAATHTELIWLPELIGQRHARDAAVNLGRLGELAELDDRRIDAVQRRGVLVERAHRLLERD